MHVLDKTVARLVDIVQILCSGVWTWRAEVRHAASGQTLYQVTRQSSNYQAIGLTICKWLYSLVNCLQYSFVWAPSFPLFPCLAYRQVSRHGMSWVARRTLSGHFSLVKNTITFHLQILASQILKYHFVRLLAYLLQQCQQFTSPFTLSALNVGQCSPLAAYKPP